MKSTRGERNFNLGNIERVKGTVWKGQSPDQSGDPRFVVFTSSVWGVRALAKIILTYSRVYPQDTPQDIDTVREIITRWAPPKNKGVVENDTFSYILAVSKELDVAPHEEIDVTDEETMKELVTAIIRHENGRVLVDEDVIADGVSRALA